ncbi:MAG: hypothetical protein A2289_26075 [Deltaproteobacteria bacterium RIFOXYA12_FULL_58_15]|nr:MAG: hypothetical protein A2289_26075 [Deltaproteobacteria bacterium RIFOXYA12_FULL_58_15]OGR14490.1 MAG: hypothetical protein A2341_04205 [Deltaproteobacteria bacterium RIFOXYB12_FULL_58_9]
MLKTVRESCSFPLFSVLLWGGLSVGCASAGDGHPPLAVVPHVDLNRYIGTWYEIARLPFGQQEGCVGTTATYGVREDGDISVVNRCLDGSVDGPERVAEGKAWVVDPSTHAKLKVQFFWPFRGDYWVIDLADDYQYAVIGMPSRKYLWILNREPTMDPDIYSAILERAKKNGYDILRLIETPQIQ